MIAFILFAFCLSLINSTSVASLAQLSPEVCLENGFNPSLLACSTCEHVLPVLGESSPIVAQCFACCLESSAGQEEKYFKAVLELDKRSLPFLTGLQEVVGKRKELGLSVRYDFSSPRLLLYKTSGDIAAAEIISVQGWGLDSFREFLQAHLLPKSKSSS
jgi:hypothetical protein